MEARMKNPVSYIPEATQPLQTLAKVVHDQGVPGETLELVHMRASQINGCAFCIDYGYKAARKAGETEDRLAAIAVWRDSRLFTDAERAALGLAEAVTRLADRPDPVNDEIWDEAARHYDEKALAALLLWIGTTNIYNRLNVPVRQEPGTWG